MRCWWSEIPGPSSLGVLLLIAALGLIPLIAPSANAQERIVGAYYPPLMIAPDGERRGFGVEICEIAARRLGREVKTEFYPFNRAMKTVERSDDALQASLFRNPTREPLFQWIAKTHEEEMVFLTLGDPIDTLDAGRSLARIGVETGSALDVFLTTRGFTNLERVDRPEINAKKLLAGRIDAWALAKNSALWTWKGLQIGRRLTAGAALARADVYVVAGRDFPPDLAEAYARVINEMRESGEIEMVIARYLSEDLMQ